MSKYIVDIKGDIEGDYEIIGKYEDIQQCELIKLFNKYDVLLVHIDGKISPVKNTTKQECYNLLYEIQELINWRHLLFKKHLEEVENDMRGDNNG